MGGSLSVEYIFHQEIGDQVIILEENMYLDSRIL
jgi:hypothetical protein